MFEYEDDDIGYRRRAEDVLSCGGCALLLVVSHGVVFVLGWLMCAWWNS